jgi:hypothetical protein
MGLYPKPFTDVMDASVTELPEATWQLRSCPDATLKKENEMIDKLSWVTIYPEIVLLVMACIIALVDLS